MKFVFFFLLATTLIILSLQQISGLTLNFSEISNTFLEKRISPDSSELPDAPNPNMAITDIANMFNERGFYKSNGFSFDEQEIVNDFNGNLMYQIPLYNYPLAGDLNFNMSLIYNGSVGHQFILGNLDIYEDYSQKYNLNTPEWMISFNGICLQTLNFETNFLTTKSSSVSFVRNDSVRLLIPGYHFSNQIEPATGGRKDRINILAGDGSVITLVNTSEGVYDGDYVYEGKELYYKAKVTFIEEGSFGYRRRKVELMKGDGTVMIFREYKRDYADFPINTSAVSLFKRPMVLLLESMNDRYGHKIEFKYAFSLQRYGRPLLTNVRATGYSLKDIDVNIEYGIIEGFENSTGRLIIQHTSEVNGSYDILFKNPVAHRPIDQYGNTNHVGMIQSIRNVLNQKIEVQYKGYNRTYNSLQYGITTGVRFQKDSIYRVSTFKTFLNKFSRYNYGATDTMSVWVGPNNKLKSANYKGYGRDEFYTNMLHSKSDSDMAATTSKSKSEYEYYFTDAVPDDNDVDSNDYYGTLVSLTNQEVSTLNQTPSNVQTLRKYKNYPIYNINDYYSEQPDLQGTTKLMSDTTYNSSEGLQSNHYIYSKGRYIDGSGIDGLNGSFLLSSKLNNQSGVKRKWTYVYTYQNDDTAKPLVSKTETDPLNNVSKNYFKIIDHDDFIYKIASNIKSNVFYDQMDLYIIGLDSISLRKDNSNNTIFNKSFEYIPIGDSSIGYLGQLRKEKLYLHGGSTDYIETEYEYYRNDTTGAFIFNYEDFLPNTNGNLKQITKPNGEREKYFYRLVSTSEMYPPDIQNITDEYQYRRHKFKMKYTNNYIKDTCATMWDTRFPIRTDNYKINESTVDTLAINYKLQNVAGAPSLMYGRDLFVSEFVYEPVHRIKSITLPGDFSDEPDEVQIIIDTHFVKTSIEILSRGWGYCDRDDLNNVSYNDQESFDKINTCQIFNDYTTNSEHKGAFIKLDTNSSIYKITVDSSILRIAPISYVATKNNNPIPYIWLDTRVNGVDYLGINPTPTSCDSKTRSASVSGVYESVQIDTFDFHCSNCCFHNKNVNVTGLINNFITNRRPLMGLTISSAYIGPESEFFEPLYIKMNFSQCDMFEGGEHENWLNVYRPTLFIYGNLNLSDTFRIPVVNGGTFKYTYDDNKYKTDIFSIRDPENDLKSKVRYSLDGFGNIKQKSVYTSDTDSNTYKYLFNYLNKPARNFDAYNDSTMFSYDILGRLKITKNTDTSATGNLYFYHDSLTNYFGSTFIGFIEQQNFYDEEGNPLVKYFDAVGNNLREIKYVGSSIPEGDNPSTALVTDYKYDSLYRISKVKTPEGKLIKYSYDGYGRQSGRITPDAGQSYYYYDENNNLIFSQDQNQISINPSKYTFRNYDGLNRLTGIGEIVSLPDSPSDGEQYMSDTSLNYLTVNVYDTISNSIVNSLFYGVQGYNANNFSKGRLAATAYRTRNTDSWNFKYYRYDERGRILKLWNIISGFDTLITEYRYNSQDQIKFLYYQPGRDEEKSYAYLYDYAGRLNDVLVRTASGISDSPGDFYSYSTYSYNKNSQIELQSFYENFFTNTYIYNKRNWISGMDNSEHVFYFENEYFKNGNVKSLELSGSYNEMFDKPGSFQSLYTYDRSNRLVSSLRGTVSSSEFWSDKAYDVQMSYDKDGNFETLIRNDSGGARQDEMGYQYYSNTNKVRSVLGSHTQYLYDYNGNVTKDSLNWNSHMLYDHRNLLTQVTHREYEDGVGLPDTAVYLSYYDYDETGNRTRKRVFKYIGTGTPSEEDGPLPEDSLIDNPTQWQLINNEVYSRGVDGKELCIYKGNDVEQWNIWGAENLGKIVPDDVLGYMIQTYLKDHLGSIRVIVDDKSNIISAQDYDAWGYILRARHFNSEESKFKFTGKERDKESGYGYFKSRYYDARIGLFRETEPIPSSSFGWSSYVYCANNPLRIIDPNGEEWYYIYDDENSGSWQYFENTPWKEVWTGKYDENGSKIMEFVQGYIELLFFQGTELQWLGEDGSIISWNAVSGIVDENDRTQPNLQFEENVGPIPEGWWIVDPQNSLSRDRDAKGVIDYLKWIYKFYAQGSQVINIFPTPDNPTKRRFGFSIHGGVDPGSIGCIDLNSRMGDFFKQFTQHNKSLLLHVDYSKFVLP